MYLGSNHRVEGAMFDFQGLGEGTGFLDKQCLQIKIYGPPDVKFGGHVEFLRSRRLDRVLFFVPPGTDLRPPAVNYERFRRKMYS